MLHKQHSTNARYRFTPQSKFSAEETDSLKNILNLQSRISDLEKKYSEFVGKCSSLFSIETNTNASKKKSKDYPSSFRLSIDDSLTLNIDQPRTKDDLIKALEDDKLLKYSMSRVSEITNKNIDLTLSLRSSKESFQEKVKTNFNRMPVSYTHLTLPTILLV